MEKHRKTIRVGPYNVTRYDDTDVGGHHVFVRLIGYSASAAAFENGSPLTSDQGHEHYIPTRYVNSINEAIESLESIP